MYPAFVPHMEVSMGNVITKTRVDLALLPLQEEGEHFNLEPLSDIDYAAWAVLLPTSYIDARDHDYAAICKLMLERIERGIDASPDPQGYRKFSRSYSLGSAWPMRLLSHYDESAEVPIPEHVRRQIKRNSHVFDFFEVRTTTSDPALFGWREGRPHLLSRWGEADINLLSFQEIRDVLIPACLAMKRSYDRSLFLRKTFALKAAKTAFARFPHLKAEIISLVNDRFRMSLCA